MVIDAPRTSPKNIDAATTASEILRFTYQRTRIAARPSLQHRMTLPAIVRECLIGLRHPMHVFPLLNRRPRIIRRVE